MVRVSLCLMIAAAAALSSGCRNSCCHRSTPPPAGVYGPPPLTRIPPAGIPEPTGGTVGEPFAPPPARPVVPPKSPEVLLPEPSPPPAGSGTKFRAGYTPRPSSSRLGTPTLLEDDATPPGDPIKPTPIDAVPRIKEEPVPTDLPAGIPAFAEVIDGLTVGYRPELEGLDWLAARKYKAVVQLRKPGEDDSFNRKEIEKRGLAFFSLEVAPETLTKEWVASFGRVVAARPTFVFDRDGSLAGVAWYLHFRLNDKLSNDESIVKARKFGLKDGTEGDERRASWAAGQKLLAGQ